MVTKALQSLGIVRLESREFASTRRIKLDCNLDCNEIDWEAIPPGALVGRERQAGPLLGASWYCVRRMPGTGGNSSGRDFLSYVGMPSR
jgi:hypothetical protein